MANDAPAYSRRSLARLTFSLGAAQLADRTTSLVATTSDSWGRPGELVHDALALVAAAEELLQRAVVVERERGASWTVLGEALDMTRQGAQQKFGAAADDWVQTIDQVMEPVGPSICARLLPGEGPEAPEQHAHNLDAWVLRHAEKPNRPRGKPAVSGGLENSSQIEQISRLSSLARRMRNESDSAKLRALYACKAALLTRVAQEAPKDEDAAERAEDARRELAALVKPANTKARKTRGELPN